MSDFSGRQVTRWPSENPELRPTGQIRVRMSDSHASDAPGRPVGVGQIGQPDINRVRLSDWRLVAVCRGRGTDAFYAQSSALGVCSACPASEVCLWTAMLLEQEAGQRDGVWDGTTPATRHRISRVCGADPGYFRHRLDTSLADLAGHEQLARSA